MDFHGRIMTLQIFRDHPLGTGSSMLNSRRRAPSENGMDEGFRTTPRLGHKADRPGRIMIMDNIQLIILIVTILGSVFAHGKIILGRVSALEGRMSAMEGRMSAMEDRLSALEGRVSALEGRMSALEDRLSAVEDRLSAVESRVSHMEGLFEGFRAAGLLSPPQSDKNQAQAA